MRHFEHLLDGITDSTRPPAALQYVLFNTQNKIVASGSGSIQVNGDGAWGIIGTDGPVVIPENGYLSVFLTNRSVLTSVHFDDLRVTLTRGRLREEHHYYPHGLPMGHIGSSGSGVENRQKHQGNEYIQDLSLRWMDFQARQYDPQIGRFLGVDPLADYYGQDRYSPYAAMGNQPESMIDPEGLVFRGGGGHDVHTFRKAYSGGEPHFGGIAPSSLAFGMQDFLHHNSWADQGGAGGGSWGGSAAGYSYFVGNTSFEALRASLFSASRAHSGSVGGSGGQPTGEEANPNAIQLEGVEVVAPRIPTHVDNFDGFWGKVDYIFNGGVVDGFQYNWNGNLVGPAPVYITGEPPLPSFGKLIKLKNLFSIFKGGNAAKGGLQLQKSVMNVMGKGYKAAGEVTVPIKNTELLNQLNTTSKGNWVKVYEAGVQNGSKIETHYFRNNTAGQVFDVKIKYNYWHQKAFKNLGQ